MCFGKGVGDGRGGSEKRGRGKKGSTRAAGATRFTRVRSCILCAPAGPQPLNSRLLRNHSVVLLWMCTQASLVLPHNKTTGHLRGRLFKGGEDKTLDIIPCEKVQHNK